MFMFDAKTILKHIYSLKIFPFLYRSFVSVSNRQVNDLSLLEILHSKTLYNIKINYYYTIGILTVAFIISKKILISMAAL